MDDIDIKLLGEFYQSTSSFGVPRGLKGSLKPISKKLGLDEDTVRNRIRKMENVGVLKGWQLIYGPGIVGSVRSMMMLDVSPIVSKEEIMRKIRLVHGVVGLVNMFGGGLLVGMLCESEQSAKRSSDLIKELTEVKIQWSYQAPLPKANPALSLTDWKIIKAMRREPLLSYSELGRAVGLSGRAARKRLGRMISERVITVVPQINLRAIEGAICIDVLVSCASPADKRRVDREVAARHTELALRVGWGGPEHAHLALVLPSLGAVQELHEWIRSLNGVNDVKINFMLEQIYLLDALDELVQSRLEES